MVDHVAIGTSDHVFPVRRISPACRMSAKDLTTPDPPPFRQGPESVRVSRLGFRMPAQREQSTPGKGRGPASESLRRTNPRDSGEELAVYGELVGQRR